MAFGDFLLHDEIIQSFEEGDWKNVLKLQSELSESHLLWLKPKLQDLSFIGHTLRRLNVSSIVSIGCGTGLLEWLLKSATGLHIEGVEVDKKYWSSKYARAHFIDMIFPEDENFLKTIQGTQNIALMFCYFNNKSAFLKYLETYKGNHLIIIGPHNNGRYTEPGPFDPDIPQKWKIWDYKVISNTGDYIVIYEKYTSAHVQIYLSNRASEVTKLSKKSEGQK